MLPLFFLLQALLVSTSTGSVSQGASCSSTNDHLDPNTHKFVSECTDATFCSVNGTCVPRQCTRDEFPFGYSSSDPIPAQCPRGSFCPDEGSGCRPLMPTGATCQLNRDEQCAPPLDWEGLASLQNFNGSICLRSVCMYANVTLGQPCIADNTTYTDFGPDGQQFNNVVTRDNCRPLLYCGAASMVCERTKVVGVPCLADQECEFYNCGPSGLCADPPETPLRVAPWQYALTFTCILGAMVATCTMLTLLHKRHRFERYKEVREYYFEQINLRRSIIALHSAAADRYLDEKTGS